MMSNEEIGKKIRQSNIVIVVLLFLSILNVGCVVFGIATQKPLWSILFNIFAALFPAYVAYRWVIIKRDWKQILWDVEFFEKMKAN